MKIITINLQGFLDEKIRGLVENLRYFSRSDFIRKAAREFIEEHDWEDVESEDKIMTVNVEICTIQEIDSLVENGCFPSRSEFFRAAVLAKIIKIEKAEEEANAIKVKVEQIGDTEIIHIPVSQTQAPSPYSSWKIIK